MPQTSRYALPLLQSGQAQKEITHNEALAQIDGLLHLVVESRRTAAPPPVPAIGTAWLVASNATGTWAGHDGAIATYDDAGPGFITPRDGCIAYVRDEGVFVCRVAGAWQDRWPVQALSVAGRTMLAAVPATIAAPTGGTTVDNEARAALAQVLAALRAMGLLAAA